MSQGFTRSASTDVGSTMRAIAARLAGAGIDAAEARLDAELIVRDVLGWDRATALVEQHRTLDPAELDHIERRVARRMAREPMAYVRGRVEFWGLEFEVGPGVLVPRPETELVVESALDCYRGTNGPASIVDACTGCGCLAVALALEFPNARVVGTDLSAEALTIAGRNATRHQVADRVEWREASLLGGGGAVDLVVANPPYVPAGDRDSLMPEVRDHEPALALFGGADGLDVVRGLVAEAESELRPGSWLVFEFGYGQADLVRALFGDGWHAPGFRHDLQRIPRVVAVERRGA
jgi:release factor glutamine methyltransferase